VVPSRRPPPLWRPVVNGIVSPLGRFGLRTRRSGLERVPAGGAIIAYNHVSFLDALLITQVSARPIRVVAERKYLRLPVLGPLLAGCGVVAVERGSGGRETLASLEGLLSAGDLVGIFPEGGLRRGVPIGPLQRGAAFTALRAGVPIVPVAIGGHRPLRPWRRRAFLHVGEPLPPIGTSRELTARLDAALRALLADAGERT
jgi:1-acyl-sn-glycerol-3-phosphate acyltransferase